MAALPLFLLRLGVNVDWGSEQTCFQGVAQELARFYQLQPGLYLAEEEGLDARVEPDGPASSQSAASAASAASSSSAPMRAGGPSLKARRRAAPSRTAPSDTSRRAVGDRALAAARIPRGLQSACGERERRLGAGGGETRESLQDL
jgi:hypothetical protein